MAEQLSAENTNKILLEGNGTAKAAPRPIPKRRRTSADVVIENSTEKRYLWTARAFAIVFGVSVCCNLILVYVIFAIMPLYRVEPYLFSFNDKQEQIYNIKPIKDIYEKKYLTEIFVREYVLLRNSFVNDIDEMEQRWGKDGNIREMSTDGVFSSFRKDFADKVLEQVRQYNITRNIKISSVTEIGGKNGHNWWQVEFRAEDMSPEYETPRLSVLLATLRIGYRTKRVKFNERLKNPLGFTVLEYKVEKVKTN